jgi:CxxC motif-containing protein (DUF1111 family)
VRFGRWTVALVAVVLVAGACNGSSTPVASTASPADAPSWLTARLGGDTTAKALRGRPFNQSARDLDNSELVRFGAGADTFDEHRTVHDGLGPDYNEDGCLSCHLDGTQRTGPASTPPGMLVRISDGGAPVAGYGTQLQTRSTTGHPEATVTPRWTDVHGHYPDGTPFTLRRPDTKIVTRTPLPAGVQFSTRTAPPIIGLGLLEAIPVASLEAAADPDDRNHDGISGRVSFVADPTSPTGVSVGRFGWKASQPSVASQTTTALREDMGITATPGPGGAAVSPPEIDPDTLADLIFYNRTIAVPVGRSTTSPSATRGAELFEKIGCAACHTPTQHSGPDAVAGLANQTFHPYTDLLLHDMGPGLADGRPDGSASGSEWRTAPLWGLGRRVEVTGREAFLHDGRARTPTEAILWHGGEAAAARERFEHLSASDRAALAAFLNSL